MAIREFPPHELADENGLLAVGGDLEVPSLLLAYKNGIFPWPVFADGALSWFSPWRRALLFLERFHLPRSLKKAMQTTDYSIEVDNDFEAVVWLCGASPRDGQAGTWITEEIQQAYIEFHKAGYAHSVECYMNGTLVGGLYGVSIGRMFAGESMFYLEPNASKFCLVYLVDYLKKRGVAWIDCQQLTPLFERFGAEEVKREEFLRLLAEAVDATDSLF